MNLHLHCTRIGLAWPTLSPKCPPTFLHEVQERCHDEYSMAGFTLRAWSASGPRYQTRTKGPSKSEWRRQHRSPKRSGFRTVIGQPCRASKARKLRLRRDLLTRRGPKFPERVSFSVPETLDARQLLRALRRRQRRAGSTSFCCSLSGVSNSLR
jgi:hypothetical protein